MNQDCNESQTLLKNKGTSHDLDELYRRQSSRLEWAESSWTRLLHVFCWWWINPILSLGYKRELTENDLDDTPHVDKISILLNRLNSYDWSSTTTTWRIVCKEFWKDYTYASLIYFPFLITKIAQPLLLRQLILNIIEKQRSSIVNYVCVAALFIAVLMQSFTERQGIFRSTRVGVRIRNALIIMIYTRSLSLKSTSWNQMNTGRIINLIANDTSKFEEVCANLACVAKQFLKPSSYLVYFVGSCIRYQHCVATLFLPYLFSYNFILVRNLVSTVI
jgi:ABC-type multidrug transport system fused ATPase/permease subunit